MTDRPETEEREAWVITHGHWPEGVAFGRTPDEAKYNAECQCGAIWKDIEKLGWTCERIRYRKVGDE